MSAIEVEGHANELLNPVAAEQHFQPRAVQIGPIGARSLAVAPVHLSVRCIELHLLRGVRRARLNEHLHPRAVQVGALQAAGGGMGEIRGRAHVRPIDFACVRIDRDPVRSGDALSRNDRGRAGPVSVRAENLIAGEAQPEELSNERTCRASRRRSAACGARLIARSAGYAATRGSAVRVRGRSASRSCTTRGARARNTPRARRRRRPADSARRRSHSAVRSARAARLDRAWSSTRYSRRGPTGSA